MGQAEGADARRQKVSAAALTENRQAQTGDADLLVGLLGAGLMADPAALGPCKICSVIWIIGSVLSILWHLFYLLYLMYSIPFLCDGKAPSCAFELTIQLSRRTS